MELASNLTWLAVTLALTGFVCGNVRRRKMNVPMGAALTLALLIGFILLPVISISDDLMESRQATLPLSAQTYRLAFEGASCGFDLLPVVGALLLMLVCFLEMQADLPVAQWNIRPIAARLARSQRLRPPPAVAY